MAWAIQATTRFRSVVHISRSRNAFPVAQARRVISGALPRDCICRSLIKYRIKSRYVQHVSRLNIRPMNILNVARPEVRARERGYSGDGMRKIFSVNASSICNRRWVLFRYLGSLHLAASDPSIVDTRHFLFLQRATFLGDDRVPE